VNSLPAAQQQKLAQAMDGVGSLLYLLSNDNSLTGGRNAWDAMNRGLQLPENGDFYVDSSDATPAMEAHGQEQNVRATNYDLKD
jgi:hypothetical protein